MPLHLYQSIHASGKVPPLWQPLKGEVLKYSVKDAAVLRELRRLAPGEWRKVIRVGTTGQVHYFEHTSGYVAGVKFKEH